MKKLPLFLVGGGIASVAAAFFAVRKSGQTTDAIKAAVSSPPLAPMIPGAPANRPAVAIHATGYWPYVSGLSAADRKMEGGTTDRKGRPLHTLEQHLSDPTNHPYVSCAGDYEIWPDGQRVSLSPWPTAVFRVVDTGGHFHGVNKVFRVTGEEPLDIAVDSSKTAVPKSGVIASIYPGDNFASGRSVVASKFKDQTVVTGIATAIVDAYYDELARGLNE